MKRIYPSKKDRRAAEYLRLKARESKLSPKPPDPITLLSEVELAYIAGLLDGEGYLTIGLVGPKRQTFYPIVAVGMTHLGVIQWLQKKLGSGTIKLNNHTSVRLGWKPQHTVKLHGKRAKLLCQHILPYLKVKYEQASIIASFPCEERKGRSLRLSPEVQAIRAELHERIMPLNKRGKAVVPN